MEIRWKIFWKSFKNLTRRLRATRKSNQRSQWRQKSKTKHLNKQNFLIFNLKVQNLLSHHFYSLDQFGDLIEVVQFKLVLYLCCQESLEHHLVHRFVCFYLWLMLELPSIIVALHNHFLKLVHLAKQFSSKKSKVGQLLLELH